MSFKEEWNWLNSYQMEAVTDENPACIVNANVGSGKTTVLIAKIVYLHYEKQIPLEQMTVLTFTNKAAGEIVERLKKQEPDLTEEQVHFFGTFHSVAMRILKESLPKENLPVDIGESSSPAGSDGWTADFEIIDPDEEQDMALQLIAEQNLKIKYKNRLKKRLEQEYKDYKKGKEASRYKDDLFRLYPLLQEEKKRQNKMSFSDLLEEATRLLKMGKTFPVKWIIVDEVQDSDAAQMEFLEALKGPETKLFAVGDPNQVIYSFRGTTQNMFFLLKNRFQAKELSLPVNYRSNASILEAANRFLQFGGKIQGSNGAGDKIQIKNHYDPFQEAMYLADRIEKLHQEGKRYQDIAIFYRLQKQAEVLEKMFESQGIPYEVSVKKSWKDIPVIDWIMKVLRFSVNQEDTQMGIQILTDKKFGEKCTKKKAEDIIVNKRIEKSDLYSRMLSFQKQYHAPEEQTIQKNLTGEELYDFLGLREALHPTSSDYLEDSRHAKNFLEQICGYCRAKNLDISDGIREFLNGALLESIEDPAYLNQPEAGENEEKNPETEDKVKLMTLHASKGLEFDTVFIIGVNPGLLPIRCSNFDQEEEERRLFFVGITRAKNHLEISYYTNPGEPGVLGNYSNYLRMIPEELLEWEELRSDEEKRTNLKELARQAKEKIKKTEKVQKVEEECKDIEEMKEKIESDEGQEQKARHPKYGTGVVTSEDDMMIEVDFPNYGKKQFIKAFQEVELI